MFFAFNAPNFTILFFIFTQYPVAFGHQIEIKNVLKAGHKL